MPKTAPRYQVCKSQDHLDAFQSVYRRLRRTGRDSEDKDVSDSMLKAHFSKVSLSLKRVDSRNLKHESNYMGDIMSPRGLAKEQIVDELLSKIDRGKDAMAVLFNFCILLFLRCTKRRLKMLESF